MRRGAVCALGVADGLREGWRPGIVVWMMAISLPIWFPVNGNGGEFSRPRNDEVATAMIGAAAAEHLPSGYSGETWMQVSDSFREFIRNGADRKFLDDCRAHDRFHKGEARLDAILRLALIESERSVNTAAAMSLLGPVFNFS